MNERTNACMKGIAAQQPGKDEKRDLWQWRDDCRLRREEGEWADGEGVQAGRNSDVVSKKLEELLF